MNTQFALAAALGLLCAVPASANAHAACPAPLVRHRATITLRATALRTFGGLPCQRGRVLVARLFDEMLRDDGSCATDSINGDGCQIRTYVCRRARLTPKGRCSDDAGHVVRWLERDSDDG